MSERSREDDVLSNHPPSEPRGEGAPRPGGAAAGRRRALLVLSRDPVPGSVLGYLRAQGLVVVTCGSPAQAAALLVKRSPEAFFLSAAGLGAEAAEVIGLARQYAPRAAVVVGLGAEARSQAPHLLRAGADGYLPGPVVAEELLALLEQVWDRREDAYREARRCVGRQTVSRLARVIAHQVNNPLGTLSGWLQMLISGPADPAALSKVAESARGELRRLEQVVKTLLILSEQMAPRREVVEVEDLVRSALAEAAEVPVRMASEVPPVLADGEEVSGALRELLFGVALGSAGTRPLALTVSVDGRMVEVDALLSNEAPGGPQLEELLDPLRVFDEEGGEAALALARAVAAVRVHGGEVTVERELDGQAHLLVRLPVAGG